MVTRSKGTTPPQQSGSGSTKGENNGQFSQVWVSALSSRQCLDIAGW